MNAVTVSFATLRKACVQKNMHARLDIFDGGEAVIVTDNADHTVIITKTSEYGDGQTATQQVAQALVEQGYLNMSDFEG